MPGVVPRTRPRCSVCGGYLPVRRGEIQPCPQCITRASGDRSIRTALQQVTDSWRGITTPKR